MFGAAPGTVNPEAHLESTIAWLSQHPAETRAGRVLRFLLERRCRHCGGTVEVLPSLDACLHCLRVLPWIGPDTARALAPNRQMLAASELVVPFAYRDRIADDLRRLKFAGDFAAAALYGALLAAAVAVRAAAGRGSPLPEILLPIPLHPTRLAERGFNQAGMIATHAARHLRLQLEHGGLQRCRATVAQTALDASARQRNLLQAFVVDRPLHHIVAQRRASGKEMPRVAVIDDVLTTGATALAAVSALRAAGLDDVQFWAVARTIPTNITSPTR